jgi:hypothetical protein
MRNRDKNNEKRTPRTLYTDRGLEFTMSGIEVRGTGEKKRRVNVRESFYKEWNIVHLHTNSVHKASLVELFNRTLRLKIQRYLTWRSDGKRITA